MIQFKKLLEDVYTSEYKIKQFVDPVTGKTKTRKIRPHRIEFKNSKMGAEPTQPKQVEETNMYENVDALIVEVLTKDASAGEWIHDFIRSDNPKFAGKSPAKRKEMALAAYYAKQRNEETEQIDEKSDQAKQNKTMKNMMDASRGARYKLNNPVPAAEPEHKTAQAHNKAIGRALRSEETDTSEKHEMAETQLHFIKYAAEEILEYIKMGGEIEEWYQNKLSKVQSEVESLHSYVEGESRRTGIKEEIAESETEMKNKKSFKSFMKKPSDCQETMGAQGYVNAAPVTQVLSKEETTGSWKVETPWKKIDPKKNPEGKVHNLAGMALKKTQELQGNQHKLDKNKNGKLDAHDFKLLRKEETELEEQAPVAPVPGQKWKDHAVMVNGNQRVVIKRANAKNYPETEGWREVAPGTKIKESVDESGNLPTSQISYQEFAMMLEYETKDGRYVHKGTYGGSYVDPEGEEDDKKKKVAKPEADVKRGRGRPVGAKSGANQKVTSGRSERNFADYTGYKLHLPNTNK